MPADRMNRDEFYTAMAPCDDARLRTILWALYWRGTAQVRERIEDELRWSLVEVQHSRFPRQPAGFTTAM